MNISYMVLEKTTNFSLALHQTQVINQPRPFTFIWVNLSFFLVALGVNTWAATFLMKLERTGLNKFIVCDCLINIVTSLLSLANQSPWANLHSELGCLAWIHTFYKTFF